MLSLQYSKITKPILYNISIFIIVYLILAPKQVYANEKIHAKTMNVRLMPLLNIVGMGVYTGANISLDFKHLKNTAFSTNIAWHLDTFENITHGYSIGVGYYYLLSDKDIMLDSDWYINVFSDFHHRSYLESLRSLRIGTSIGYQWIYASGFNIKTSLGASLAFNL